jgi:hypothetical protein
MIKHDTTKLAAEDMKKYYTAVDNVSETTENVVFREYHLTPLPFAVHHE